MKKILIIILIAFIETGACTTFLLKTSGALLFCRNYDYDLGSGFIVINRKGVAKRSFISAPFEPLEWVSKYGSVTFNQIGIDAPMGGMNERGLVIAQMALIESKYPVVKEGTALNQLEWIQYQLDTSQSLEEVIKNSMKLRIVPVATPVHYFISDSLGEIAVIEFLDGKIVVRSGDEVTIPVCSNMIYDQSKVVIKDYDGFGGTKPIPRKWKNIKDIIAIANSRIDSFQKNGKYNPIEYCFETLALVGSPERTQWSVVYDIKNMQIHFKSLGNKDTRTINFHQFDFDCKTAIQILDIQTSNNLTHLKSQFFTLTKEYYYAYKENLIHWLKRNVKGFPNIPSEMIEKEVEYFFSRRNCYSDKR